MGTQSNATPTADFSPYLGDFYDLSSIDNTFFGIFSASNADNGTNAFFPDVSYQRDFTGNPGTSTFSLVDASNNTVNSSIDPYAFSFNPTQVPEPPTLPLLTLALFGLIALHRRRAGSTHTRNGPTV